MRCLSRGQIVCVAAAAAAGSGWKRLRVKDSLDFRIEQAVSVGAEVLVTSCPYCIAHFEESRLTLEDSESLEVKDITEIIAEVI